MKFGNIKPKLIILSDLWGKEKSYWVDHYVTILENNFEIKYYDCCELGELNKTEYYEESLHDQFINGGIERAVENLIEKEKDNIHILAFSIGGLISWKASLLGLKSESIFAISSTRLRKETEKPNCIIQLFYGENDEYKPESNWFLKLKIENQIVKNENHNLYQNKEFAEMLTKKIIKKIKPNG
ncbi:alpha/beta hydrolase [Flavobacterium sp. H122]|uniref:alpha/beta hydrolase n=1 Tax=Flavobacterium sp. H122 TaxID=2529860 RepID=UPI0010AB2328|nr:alpha/beta hydrolase [Flavobacterium sp. H122]